MLHVFDVNETLLDLSPLDELFGGAEQRRGWFALLVRTALVRTAARSYRPFGELGVEAAAALGMPVDPDRLRGAFAALPAHADVPGGLAALGEAGHTLVALGNSARDLVEEQLTRAGIREHFARVHSADDVGELKPARAAYLSALEGTPPGDAVLVAAHDWDLAGARCAGLRTALVDRGLPAPLPGLAPDRTVRTIAELAAS